MRRGLVGWADSWIDSSWWSKIPTTFFLFTFTRWIEQLCELFDDSFITTATKWGIDGIIWTEDGEEQIERGIVMIIFPRKFKWVSTPSPEIQAITSTSPSLEADEILLKSEVPLDSVKAKAFWWGGQK